MGRISAGFSENGPRRSFFCRLFCVSSPLIFFEVGFGGESTPWNKEIRLYSLPSQGQGVFLLQHTPVSLQSLPIPVPQKTEKSFKGHWFLQKPPKKPSPNSVKPI